METDEMSILDELIREVKTYLPEIQTCLDTLAADPSDMSATTELHRLTHTISGAASMVGLTELGNSAQILEKLINKIKESDGEWSEELLRDVGATIDDYKEYFDNLPGDLNPPSGWLEQTIARLAPYQLPTVSTDLDTSDEETLSLEEMLFDDSGDSDDSTLESLFQDDESSGDGEDDLPSLESLLGNDETEEEETETVFKDQQEHPVTDVVDGYGDADTSPVEQAPAQPELSSFEQEMRESFLEEAAEHLSVLMTELNRLDGSISGPTVVTDELREILHVIRRAVHTLKGAAAVVGIETVAAWGHRFEDFLDWLHDDARMVSADIVSILMDAAELLERLVEEPGRETASDSDNISTEFNELIERDGKNKPSLDPKADSGSEPAAQPELSSFEQEMRESFLEEAAEHLSVLLTELNRLDGSISGPTVVTDELREILHVIRRAVHTLKGAAAVVGIETVAAWGHRFEDFLDWLHDDARMVSADIVSILMDAAELLERLVEEPGRETASDSDEISAKFDELIERDGKTEPSPEPKADSAGSDSFLDDTIAVDQELEDSFADESEEYLEGIGRQLNLLANVVLESTIIDRTLYMRIDTVRKNVHGIKGAAAVIGHGSIAEWGKEFEAFLDQLLAEGKELTPDIVAVMVQAANTLESFFQAPETDLNEQLKGIRAAFADILRHIVEETVETDKAENVSQGEERTKRIIIQPRSHGTRPGRIRKKALRVTADKLDRISGLSGDLSINLGSFENSSRAMQDVLNDFSQVLQRLKGIASSLEAGYELATIPHFGAGGADDGKSGTDSLLDEFDPLELDRYSELNILIRSMQEAVLDLESVQEQEREITENWLRTVERQSKLVTDTQTSIQSIQMTPFSSLSNRLYRTVRESARATGKTVRLAITGGTIEMDTHVWDILADPLMHMLRNAVDHGIEDKQTRVAAGKPPQASIKIACARRGSSFVLRLSDDGAGLDYQAIRAKADTLYPDMNVQKMRDSDLAAMIFRQGFSVRSKVSDISGRGVGMDVVRDAVEQLNGHIEVASIQGRSLEFIITVPIVVAQFPALIVNFGDQTFAVPMRDVNRVIRLPELDPGAESLELAGETLEIRRPSEIFQIVAQGYGVQGSSATRMGLVAHAGNKKCVLIADQILGRKEVVFKGLGQPLDGMSFIAGATIMGDGSLVPIVNTEDLLNADIVSDVPVASVRKKEEKKIPTILFADDSISIRKVLEKFISYYGWSPLAAHDGVDAMEKLREQRPDLILLDIEMPRMNGFEVLQAIKSQADYRDIPILMLTSRTATKYRDKAAALGARGFVTKPFKDQDLKGLITALLNGK